MGLFRIDARGSGDVGRADRPEKTFCDGLGLLESADVPC